LNRCALTSGSNDRSRLIGKDLIGNSIRLTLERIVGFADRNFPSDAI
jgi:hypothetical protein